MQEVDTLKTQLANLNVEHGRLIDKFKDNRDKLKQTEVENNNMKKDLKFYKEDSELKVKQIKKLHDRVKELEQRIAKDNKQKPSTSKGETKTKLIAHK